MSFLSGICLTRLIPGGPMYTTHSTVTTQNQAFAPALSSELTAFGSMATEKLGNEHQPEILAFLAARPLHTVIMAGHIRDNGVVSPFNRGTFHAYRGLQGELEGVALIGHATLIDARSSAALRAFARVAQTSSDIRLIIAEEENVGLFWSYYATAGQRLRAVVSESMLELRWPVAVEEVVRGLRRATVDDLQAVMEVQANMAMVDRGVNPMEIDPVGFKRRCARRIDLGRTWVWREGQHLIFKVDIMAATPEALYLEGVWVNPQERGKNYGLRCVTQVSRRLLSQSASVCVLVNESNLRAQAFYRKAGFKQRALYQSVFVESAPRGTEA